MVRLGIIGPGLIWRNTHRSILAELHEKVGIVAAAARSRENQETAREAYPDATIYSDARDLIADPEVEAVVVLTPISLNAPMAKAALAAGKHVVMEKPVAISVEEAEDLYAAEHRSTGTVYVLEQYLYRSILSVVRRMITEGAIGNPVCFERSVHVRIAAENDLTGGYGSTDWRATPDFPLGNFFDGGIHEIAFLQEVFGPARAVFARGRSLRPDFGDVDILSMVVEYPEGVQGTISHSSILGRQGDSFVIHGTEAAMVVRRNELHLRDPRDGTETEVTLKVYPESLAMWEEIISLIPSGRPARYTPSKALADLEFMSAVTRSLVSGRMESIGAGGARNGL